VLERLKRFSEVEAGFGFKICERTRRRPRNASRVEHEDEHEHEDDLVAAILDCVVLGLREALSTDGF
jgi:hypothetical protein